MEQRACKSCARAKRRCDRQEPRCTRCRRRGIQCSYPAAKQTAFVLCTDDNTSSHQLLDNIFSCGPAADPFNKLSQTETQPASDWLDEWNLGFLSLPVSPRSVAHEQLVRFVTMIREWLTQWVDQGSNPFIHAFLYRSQMPPCVQDAYTTLSCYLHKKPSNEQMIFRIVEDRAKQLIASEGVLPTKVSDQSGKDSSSLNSIEHLARVQSLFVYQVLGLFDGDIRLRHFAESQIPVLDNWVQAMVEHVAKIVSLGDTTNLCSREQLQQYIGMDQDVDNRDTLNWYSWILAESIQRTWMMASGIHAIYLMLQQSVSRPCLGYMVFTTQKGFWEAPSAVAWSKLCSEKNTGLVQMAEADRVFTEAAPEDVNDFTKVFLQATFGTERMERWMARARDQR
jgi:Fungal Zn(2)-Cys(6) binuclear cluster domain